MTPSTIHNVSRRDFLRAGLATAAGLTLGVRLVEAGMNPGAPGVPGERGSGEASFEPNAFVRIRPEGTVTVISKHLEMGQGTYTGLATLVAEELDANWDDVRVEGAPADAERYNNLLWGPMQGTGGSTAIANAYTQMRRAGAAARAMLVEAAADAWAVDPGEIHVAAGRIRHPGSGRSAGFGTFAEAAATYPVPDQPTLKQPEDFRLIGQGVPRQDSPEKINGTAVYTQDIQRPGMLTALVAHPPRFGAGVANVEATEAKAVPGVKDVVTIPSGVAVLGTDFWSAKKGRDALRITWDESEAMTEGSEELIEAFRGLTQKPGAVARQVGDPEQAEASAERVLEAEFVFPYLAHAALEPMNCVLERTEDGGVQVYNGEQFQTVDQAAIAEVLGLKPAQVRIAMLYAGGSFGRRANPHSDYLREAAHIVKAIEGRAPVKLMWTREDDMQAGYFRPLYVHRMRAGVDAAGQPVSWLHRIVGQSIMTGTVMESAQVKDGVDNTSVEGARNVPYDLPNLRVDLHSPQVPVPVQWWRAVGSTHTAFAVETFIDELAEAAGEDPVAFRLARLPDHPRHRGVLELAAEQAGWGKAPLPEGRGRGVAVHESFNSYVAQVVEVTVQGGDYRVDRVVIAVDCGVPVNPDIIKAQMEGGMGFGLSAVLKSEITLEEGRVQQSNFHNYNVLRLNEMPPAIEVHIVPSTEAPTGVGEPAVPVIAPAVANALYQVTGQRHRRLPIRL